MKKERKTLPVARLELNAGQIDWLPRNPRQWTKEDVEKTAKSIAEDEDFLEERPILVVPMGEKFVVFAGNLRSEGAKKRKMKEAPCVIYNPETEADQQAIIRRAAKDNGSFGSFDWDILANEWDGPLQDWGIPSWPQPEGGASGEDWQKDGLSTEGREGAEGYDEFVNKFNLEKPVTTDDCYTPPEVYDIVRDFVDRNVAPLKGRKIVRPFYPGGDYEKLGQYPTGCVVLDNPPFSIYAKIVRFYLEKGIDFFLFGPALSLIVAEAKCTFIVTASTVRYENGAVVSTGFVTNMCGSLRLWVEPTLRTLIAKAQEIEPTTTVYAMPDEVVTAAGLQKIARGEELKIIEDECHYIRDLDKMKEDGRGLFGGGFLLSKAAAEKAKAAAEKARAAAEKARAAAEKARAIPIELSEREKAIVEKLK